MDDAQAWGALDWRAKRDGLWFPRSGRDHDLFLFAVRNPIWAVGPWACVIGAARLVAGSPDVRLWLGTTLPGHEGDSGDRANLHPDGVACVVPGQHRGAWALGNHKEGRPGAHPAFVQHGAIPVYRDTVIDGMARPGKVWMNARGINGHAAYRRGLPVVSDASHGCIVWHDPEEHAEAVEMGRDQVRHIGAQSFSLTLWDGARCPDLWWMFGAVGVPFDDAWGIDVRSA